MKLLVNALNEEYLVLMHPVWRHLPYSMSDESRLIPINFHIDPSTKIAWGSTKIMNHKTQVLRWVRREENSL
jgi:hypothetical protein